MVQPEYLADSKPLFPVRHRQRHIGHCLCGKEEQARILSLQP
jgi:hypothetical protein